MQLNELRPSDAKLLVKTDLTLPIEIIKYLESQGYEKLGEGQYAQVWGMPNSNAVIKVSTQQDKCWLRFVEFVHSEKSPFLPKISRIKRWNYDGKNYFIAFIERLKSLPYNSKWLNFALRVESLAVTYKNRFRPTEADLDFADNNIELAGLIKRLSRFIERNPCSFDFHVGNFMQRPKTGQLVIIDPFNQFEVNTPYLGFSTS